MSERAIASFEITTRDEQAAYLEVERVSGRVNGREGSFVDTHAATAAGGTQAGDWPVVAGSATEELAGIGGQLRIDVLPEGGPCSPSTTSWADRAGSSAPWRPW